MALELDGFETWRTIANHPAVFARLRAEAAKTARSALSKLLKSRATGLAEMREIRRALGKDIFVLAVNGMKDGEIRTLVSRLDKHHPELKLAGAEWRRRHLLALAGGEADPVKKPEPARRSGPSAGKSRRRAAETPAEPRGLSYVSAGATRTRRSRKRT